jgi:protein-S-isoprenylcysteine O-methyltransferase Ste14
MYSLVVRAVALMAVSALIAIVSWPSLRHPRSHGFYRFFAFEAILILLLLNVGAWFAEPFAPHQLVSWALLLASLALAVHSFFILWKLGQPDGGIEHTTRLVRDGAYQYIRHPLYSSLLLLAWGILFKRPSLLGGALALTATAFLAITARVEERENLLKFGSEYAGYLKMTWMFIPHVF